MTTGAPLVVGQAVTRRFGGLIAVNAVDIEVREGEIFGLIGPNGAGKTTLFRLLSGIYRPTSGSITLRGTEIGGRSAHAVTALGIATTHQIVRPFPEMPVEKNVLVGVLYGRSKLGGRAADEEVERILELTELMPHRDTLGRSLTLARRKRPLAGEHLDVRTQARERRAQLVRCVGDELSLLAVGILEGGEHRVEARAQPAQLVGAVRLDPLRQIARLRDPLRRSRQAPHRRVETETRQSSNGQKRTRYLVRFTMITM